MASTGNARVASSPIAGQGLFASADIKPGELIFDLSRPAVAAMDTGNLDTVCSNCFVSAAEPSVLHGTLQDSVTVKACTGCKTLRYCSKQCQTESWNRNHKYECKILKNTSARGQMPHAARALLQMMAATSDIADSPFKGLNSHLEDVARAGGEQYENLLVLATGIHQYTQTKLSLDYLKQCFAMILTNSFSLVTQTYDSLGVCLDPFAARANHSCSPNAYIVFDGAKMSFRALERIKKDEEILVSYIESSNPYHLRQRELLKRYFFRCQCTKCQQGVQTVEDRFLQNPEKLGPRWDKDIRWPTGMMDGFAVSDPNDKSNYVSDSAVGASLEATQWLARKQLENARRYPLPIPQDQMQEVVDTIQVGLSVCLQTHIWPEHRQPLAAIRQFVFTTFLSFKQGLKIYFYINPVLYPQTFHPLRVVHNWTLMNLLLYYLDPNANLQAEAELRDAGVEFGIVVYGLLLEVYDNVTNSHGRDSTFAKEVRRKMEEVTTDMTRGDAKQLQGVKNRIEPQWRILRKLADSPDLESVLG